MLISRVVFLNLFCVLQSTADGMEVADSNEMTLETVRDSLIREEDTIIFSLIERTKYPINVGAYDKSKTAISGCSNSLVEFMVKETEAAYAKVRCIVLLLSHQLYVFESLIS